MAGTCPNCGIKISGQLRNCPNCGAYYLLTQDTCPECKSKIESPPPSPNPSPKAEGKKESTPPHRKKRKKARRWGYWLGTVILLIICGIGYYYYNLHRMQQREQADYERLANVTNPEFFQQFLIDYPESQYCNEIKERMLVLQNEAKEWEKLLQDINRANVLHFMQNHPSSLRQRICDDMLDSIDWQDAQGIGSEAAVTDYLTKHPSGRYVTEAAEKKNALLLAKVTPEERTMIRGTLEAFFSKAIANQDIDAAREAMSDSMMTFCGKQDADAEAIVQYAREKMEKDVIGLHYLIGEKMSVHKETLPDSNIGFSIEVSLTETISRSDTNQPTSNTYRVTALLNQEQKIVRLNISK